MEHNLQKYIALVRTVELGSFTKAAESLHYAQSSVSKMISDLESEWDVMVLERGKNGVCLTSSGEQLLPYVKTLIDDCRKLDDYVNKLHGMQTGIIRIGTFSSVAINWLPQVFAQLQKNYPKIEYEMLLGDYAEIQTWIEEGRVDCGFLTLPTTASFDVIPLEKDEYQVVLPKNHPWVQQDTIDISQLQDQPFLLLEHGGKTEVTDLLRRANVQPDIRFTTWEDFAIMAMVEKGLGIGILPALILQNIPYDLAIRPLSKPYFRDIGLAVKDRRKISPATQMFIEYLQDNRDPLLGA